MRILVANFFPAHFPPRSGGEQRYFHLYRHLSERHDVTLLSANYADKPVEYVEHSPSFREYRVPKPQVSDQLHWELYRAGIGDECSGFVVGVSGAGESLLRMRFRELLHYADVVVHECPFTFTLDETAYSDGKPRVYASYNVEHRLAALMLQGEPGVAATSFIRFVEEMLVARADLVFATSEQERVQFAADFGADPAKIRLAPNGFEPGEGEAPPGAEEAPFVVFLGSGHPPNVEAGRFICDTLAPALPELEFRIMGSVCAKLGDGVPPNVKLLGFVAESEMRRQLRACSAALNPLFSGAGTNLKMLQYMEAGAPILTSEVGARGLDLAPDVEALVREPAAFAGELRGLASEPRRWQGLGAAARRKAHGRYTWGEIAARYASALEELPLSVSRGARTRLLHVNDYPVTELMGGGQVRILELLRELSTEFDLQLLCLTRDAGGSEVRIGRDARQRAFPVTPEHHDAETRADQGQLISVRDIVAGEWVLRNAEFVAAFREALPHAAAVVFEHPYLAPLLDLVPAHMPVVYASQNVEADLKKVLLAGRQDGAAWAQKAALLEERMARRADAIVAVCGTDAAAFRERYPGKRVLLIENGVTPPGAAAVGAKEGAAGERPRAVFLGSSHPPNIAAARFIIERLGPALPGIGFDIVGSVSQAVAGIPRGGNVSLHGTVSEERKSQILAGSTLAINPVAVGGGSSLKVPDFLSAGLPLVSTASGARGFELRPGRDYIEADAASFAARIEELAADAPLRSRIGRAGRRAIRRMAWPALGARYRRFLRALARRARPAGRPRLLVVTYRLMHPAPGGAESYLNRVLANHGGRRDVTVDVAACDVGSIQDHWHFSARYGAAPPPSGAPEGVSNVFRFAIEPPVTDAFEKCRRLHSAWMRESCAQWETLFGLIGVPALLGGWNHAERSGDRVWRWSSLRAQVGVMDCDAIRVEGSSRSACGVSLVPAAGSAAAASVQGEFTLEAPLAPGRQIVELVVDQPLLAEDDPRELGVSVHRVALRRAGSWEELDIRSDAEQLLRRQDAEAWIDSLVEVTEARSPEVDALFAEVRGPHSRDLRDWLERNVCGYDAVIVQGTPFAPIAWAPPIARAYGVPVVLLPHYHVEDRYYHWNAYYREFRQADSVLAFPSAIKPRFLDKLDAAADLIAGGGIDLAEYSPQELERCRAEFARIHASARPYALLLGRKAGGKRYPLVLEAAALAGGAFEIVMIGPDDDGQPVGQAGVHYYGARPRDFVLGALAGCACLVNMSESESFGIVLLESWSAGRPVVAQRRCLAFAELVAHGENGFLAESPGEIRDCIARYVADPALAARHGAAGRELAKGFSWESVADRLYEIVVEGVLAARQPVAAPAAPAGRDASRYVADSARTTLQLLASGAVHDPDFEACRQWTGIRVGTILDIGANRGQSAVSLHAVFPGAVIHSFEANPILFPVLDEVAASLGGRCVVHRYGLGREAGSFKLYVPWAAGQPWLEESSTCRDYYDKPWVAQRFAERGGLELEEVTAAIRVGDDLGLDPQLIKIDVEGAENDVLEGLAETIRRSRPILLVENSDWDRVTPTLARLGYRPFRWEPGARRLVPFYGESTNAFYLHESAHAALVEVTASTGADA
jgi:FkbM family methyltransferase